MKVILTLIIKILIIIPLYGQDWIYVSCGEVLNNTEIENVEIIDSIINECTFIIDNCDSCIAQVALLRLDNGFTLWYSLLKLFDDFVIVDDSLKYMINKNLYLIDVKPQYYYYHCYDYLFSSNYLILYVSSDSLKSAYFSETSFLEFDNSNIEIVNYVNKIIKQLNLKGLLEKKVYLTNVNR